MLSKYMERETSADVAAIVVPRSGIVQSGIVQSGIVQSGIVQSGIVQSGIVQSGGGLPKQNARRARGIIDAGESLLDMGVGVGGGARVKIAAAPRQHAQSPKQMAQLGTDTFAGAVGGGHHGRHGAVSTRHDAMGHSAVSTRHDAMGVARSGAGESTGRDASAADVKELEKGSRFFVKAGGQSQPHSVWLSRDHTKLQWRVCEQRQLGGAASGKGSNPDGVIFVSDIKSAHLKTSRYMWYLL
jgi:hypothetical protein